MTLREYPEDSGLFRLLKMLGPKFMWGVITTLSMALLSLAVWVVRLEANAIMNTLDANAAKIDTVSKTVDRIEKRQIEVYTRVEVDEKRLDKLEDGHHR